APAARPATPQKSIVFRRRIGMDESGKGDYFGPLVAASVLLPDAETERFLREKGVRDSKLVPDPEALLLASLVRARCPTSVVVLPPSKYNDLYEKIGNLNTLLAWAHARALEDLLAEHPCDLAILDQFAKAERVMGEALMERGRAVTLQQAVGAEADTAVAAASLVARGEFLRGLAELSTEAGMTLPKGAGPGVIQAARAYVARHGRPALRGVAKLHFATTERVDTRQG
ncbi:MAG TPA: ribonuclease HIII, partial [Candidatus Thermoplasmatota archaeon]|nr:ribonuclease HIII [Candidatus Thermoplasmatota archaeon]